MATLSEQLLQKKSCQSMRLSTGCISFYWSGFDCFPTPPLVKNKWLTNHAEVIEMNWLSERHCRMLEFSPLHTPASLMCQVHWNLLFRILESCAIFFWGCVYKHLFTPDKAHKRDQGHSSTNSRGIGLLTRAWVKGDQFHSILDW